MPKQSIFFIGGRDRGYLFLRQILDKKLPFVGAVIMEEEPHESEQYAEKIAAVLKKAGIPFRLTRNGGKNTYQDLIEASKPSLLVVMGWRWLIPANILAMPHLRAVAVHESLLPKYRGFAPVNWAVINGESQTGVTLFYLKNDVDNGDIIAQRRIRIGLDETARDVYQKARDASVELLSSHLLKLLAGKAVARKQNEKEATYCCARVPDDGEIHWSDKTKDIYNLIRGLSYPYPGAWTLFKGEKMVIWEAKPAKNKVFVGRVPGRVVGVRHGVGVEVLTSDGALLIETVEIEEKKNASLVLNSIRYTLGR